MIIFAAGGGSGIEERAASTRRIACDVNRGPLDSAVGEAVASCGLSPAHATQLAESIRKLFAAARSVEARSLEINPLVLTKDGQFVAADCRITIDDYAVARHPELRIEIAREFDHPPTALERVAYAVEQSDHRGTFYFAQLATAAAKDSKGLVGFHGAGGGGSMMSMDAIVNAGFTIANFTDTSGNPSASKVYRASRIILAQPDLVGYFGSGSGVASQEQYWSAYGLAKAFWELDLDIPAVIRLGGNTEDRAVDILRRMSELLRAPVEGYRKTDAPAMIADALRRTCRERGRDQMETARAARAEVRQGSIGHHASGERRSGVDRHREVAAKFARRRDALWRIDRRSRRSARVIAAERGVRHQRFRVARVRCRVSTRRSRRLLS